MNIGIIGVGVWGRKLLKSFSSIISVNIIRCANKHDVCWIKENYPHIKTTLDYHEIINDPSIDAIVISVPHSELYQITKDSLLSGKHVFVEKPFAVSSSQAKGLMSLKQKDQILFVGYIFLYHPLYKTLKDIFLIDPLISIDFSWKKLGTFNNNIMLNLASHFIAMSIDIFSAYPISSVLKELADDSCTIKLKFDDLRESRINIDRTFPIERKEICCVTQSGRKLFWIDNKLYDILPDTKSKRLLYVIEGDDLRGECRRFVECVNKNIEPVTNGLHALYVLRVIESLFNDQVKYIDKNYIFDKYGLTNGLPVIDILQLFPNLSENIKSYSFLDGTSSLLDIALLKSLARRNAHCRYLEIGTWRGESIANVSEIASECVSIDLNENDVVANGYAKDFIKNMRFFSKDIKNIEYITHDSHTFDFSVFKDKFDLIFIDGDHSYEGVGVDTENAFKLLRNEKSVIVWHDYGTSPQKVRKNVLAGILDGCPTKHLKNLYHVSNTLCAIYINLEPNDKIVPGYVPVNDLPTKSFEVSIIGKKLN